MAKRQQQIVEYVKELFRVYAKNPNPSEEEMKEYTDALLNKTRSFQEVEDEFKLMNLTAPKK